MLPLAQLSPDQLHPLVQFLVGGSACLFLVNQAMSFWKEHVREQPIPGDTYATKKELNEAHGRISRERKELDAAIARAEATQKEAAQRLDAELHAIRESLEEAAAAGEARVERLREKMDEQTNLIISVIRKEGAR